MKDKFNLKSSVAAFKGRRITDFEYKVYEACTRIPKGKVSTYKLIAKEIGSPNAFRAVGTSLRKNPFAPQVPCHRVVASGLSLGGFSGSTDPNGEQLKKKRNLLKSEGVQFSSIDSDRGSAVRVHEESVFNY